MKNLRKGGVKAEYTKRKATTLSFVLTDQDAFGKQENLQARCLGIGLVLSFFFVCENTIMTEGSNCCLCKNMGRELEDCKIHSARIPEMRFVLDLHRQLFSLFSTSGRPRETNTKLNHELKVHNSVCCNVLKCLHYLWYSLGH